MKPQFENVLMSSMVLWFDHTLIKKGEDFSNYNSEFYPITNIYNGYYTYGSPFKNLIRDESITGVNIISGVYLNNNFITTGQSGLVAINADQGQLYFSSELNNPTISGNYAVKDYGIYLTNENEEKILFETKFNLNPKTTENPTGLPINAQTYPAIYLKNNGGNNTPLAFGGLDSTNINVRAIVISDSIFSMDAVTSIFKDVVRTYIPIIQPNEMPFNSLNGLKSRYNYDLLTTGRAGTSNSVYIKNVYVSKNVTNRTQYQDLNPDAISSFIDFELEVYRYPRSS
jgi:hypothetical protein